MWGKFPLPTALPPRRVTYSFPLYPIVPLSEEKSAEISNSCFQAQEGSVEDLVSKDKCYHLVPYFNLDYGSLFILNYFKFLHMF